MHTNLLAAGLVTTDTVGQLNVGDPLGGLFPDVSALPSDNTYAGFVEYALNDSVQGEAPVVIKIEYGCGTESYRSGGRSRTPRVRVTVSFDGKEFSSFCCPQELWVSSSSNNTQLVTEGISYFSHDIDKGFLGLFYGVGSRNKPMNVTSVFRTYHGSTLSLLLQRTVDEYGNPTADGLMIYHPNITAEGASIVGYTVTSFNQDWFNATNVLQPSLSQYIGSDNYISKSDTLAPFVGGVSAGVVDGKVQFQNIFAATPKPIPFPWVLMYAHPIDNPVIPTGNTFEIDINGGTHTFIAVGNETNLSCDYVTGHRMGIAMLFEGD